MRLTRPVHTQFDNCLMGTAVMPDSTEKPQKSEQTLCRTTLVGVFNPNQQHATIACCGKTAYQLHIIILGRRPHLQAGQV